jgi:ABC-2 type transport system permease protein
MNLKRINAVVWRHLYNFKHSLDRMVDSFYWPAMDILTWGITSSYIQQTGTKVPMVLVMILSGLVLWTVVYRSQYEITINLLEELWSTNLVNLFTTPLTVGEWLVAIAILSFIKMVITIVFSAGLIWLLYQVKLVIFGWWLLPFMAILLIFGWALGFFVAGLILRYGMRIQALAWTTVYILSPFSAVFYPLSTLPLWAQKIGLVLPTSYIFEGMRTVLFGGAIDPANLIKSAGLTLVYLLGSIIFFLVMFKQAKVSGLARLE